MHQRTASKVKSGTALVNLGQLVTLSIVQPSLVDLFHLVFSSSTFFFLSLCCSSRKRETTLSFIEPEPNGLCCQVRVKISRSLK